MNKLWEIGKKKEYKTRRLWMNYVQSAWPLRVAWPIETISLDTFSENTKGGEFSQDYCC